jgi:hypothetical protein
MSETDITDSDNELENEILKENMSSAEVPVIDLTHGSQDFIINLEGELEVSSCNYGVVESLLLYTYSEVALDPNLLSVATVTSQHKRFLVCLLVNADRDTTTRLVASGAVISESKDSPGLLAPIAYVLSNSC